MSFEERIDRLTERHEALAQTVQQIEETQQRQQKLAEALLVAMREEHVANREANREQRERIDALVNATESLFQTASRHEARINKLEHDS